MQSNIAKFTLICTGEHEWWRIIAACEGRTCFTTRNLKGFRRKSLGITNWEGQIWQLARYYPWNSTGSRRKRK